MFKIKNVQITGFWGKYKIETSFNPNVNIFIGRNGTGKTTFINILQAVFSVDLEVLSKLQFEQVLINLFEGKRKKSILVKKNAKEHQYKEIIYRVGRNSNLKFPIFSENKVNYLNKRNGRLHPQFFVDLENVKNEIGEIINVSYLSVNRDNKRKYELRDLSKEDIFNVIDLRLEELIGMLTSYQLQLETELSKLSKKFQDDVFRTAIFNKDFDFVDLNEKVNLDLYQIKDGLFMAFKKLEIFDNDTEKNIEEHIDAIEKAANSINMHIKDPSLPIYSNDVTPLTLLRRTNYLIELSNKLENKKIDIFKSLNNYVKLLNDFHDSKDFTLQDSKIGGLSITSENTIININELSSGEKQLIILLTEALLQKGKKTLFIADEPELSLHIEWQRKVISSIREINPNSQVIVATHSPEILGNFKEFTINMERIIYE